MTSTNHKRSLTVAMLSFAITIHAADRPASIETTGKKAELEYVLFHADDPSNVRICSDDNVLIDVKGLLYCVPIDRLISGERSGDVFTATYMWRNKQTSVSGRLVPGFFYGRDAFGSAKFKSTDINKIRLNPLPTPEKVYPPEFAGTMTAVDGAKLAVTKLRRIDPKSDVNISFPGNEAKMVAYHYSDIRFDRDGAVATVEFSKMKKVEFGPAGTVAVTLTSGQSATGTISTAKDAGISLFELEDEHGEYYIPFSRVKTIELQTP